MAGPPVRPDRLDDTLDGLQAASHDQVAVAQQLHAAEQAIADCQGQLAQYRAALDAGADPAEVTAWINQATAAKAAAEAERARLRATTPKPLDRAALRRVVTEAGGLLKALDNADRTRRGALYERLGIEGSTSPRSGWWSSPPTWYAKGWCRRVDTPIP